MKPIVDIHMHVIPGVDDGSNNIKESINMIRKSYEQCVRYIFCTSHSYVAYSNKEASEKTRNKMQELDLAQFVMKDVNNKYRVKLFQGCEIAYSSYDIDETVEKLNSGIIPTMNNTKFVLGDFWPTNFPFEEAVTVVKSLADAGYKPILAHVERYSMTSPETIRELKDMGAYVQINAYSVGEEQNPNVRKRAKEMLDNQLVDFIGSDAHRMEHRPPMIRNGIAYMYENYDKDYIEKITHDNAMELLIEGKGQPTFRYS